MESRAWPFPEDATSDNSLTVPKRRGGGPGVLLERRRRLEGAGRGEGTIAVVLEGAPAPRESREGALGAQDLLLSLLWDSRREHPQDGAIPGGQQPLRGLREGG